jgi:hypothetical protein
MSNNLEFLKNYLESKYNKLPKFIIKNININKLKYLVNNGFIEGDENSIIFEYEDIKDNIEKYYEHIPIINYYIFII